MAEGRVSYTKEMRAKAESRDVSLATIDIVDKNGPRRILQFYVDDEMLDRLHELANQVCNGKF